MTNDLKQRIEEWKSLRPPAVDLQQPYLAKLIDDLIAEVERLEENISDLRKMGQDMAMVTNTNAQWFPMLQKAEKENARLKKQLERAKEALKTLQAHTYYKCPFRPTEQLKWELFTENLHSITSKALKEIEELEKEE